MSTLGNIIWFVFGGVFLGIAWCLYGVICFVSIIGIPWGRACFTMANFCFFPFGREAVRREYLTGKKDIGTGVLGTIGNIIWCIIKAHIHRIHEIIILLLVLFIMKNNRTSSKK